MQKANVPAIKPAFHAVDASSDPARLVSYLSTYSGLHAVKAMKKKAIKRLALRADSIAADLGCGLGEDAISMSKIVTSGQIVAIDASQIFITEAENRKRYWIYNDSWLCGEEEKKKVHQKKHFIRELQSPPANVQFKVGDICKMQFETSSLDAYVDCLRFLLIFFFQFHSSSPQCLC